MSKPFGDIIYLMNMTRDARNDWPFDLHKLIKPGEKVTADFQCDSVAGHPYSSTKRPRDGMLLKTAAIVVVFDDGTTWRNQEVK